MRAVVAYESMFGNTRQIADAIGTGLVDGCVVSVIPVAQAGPDQIKDADLVVVGGPTHVHGMTRASTRHSAAKMAGDLPLSPAERPRGSAARSGITGMRLSPTRSFIVTKQNTLEPGEEDRARTWGAMLAASVSGASR